MENHHRRKGNTSGDNFTFPAMSPDMQMESELADHLFSNGKFLLHPFPLQPRLTSCTFSRTSSVGSKDSLLSSRSNSTNSRSSSSCSSCSSARTSISDASTGAAMKTRIFPEKGSRSPVHNCNNYYHLAAQRWQFMAPVPVLNRRASQKRKGDDEEKRKGSPEKKKCSRRKGYSRKFLRWLVSTCKQCHAMEPSKKRF